MFISCLFGYMNGSSFLFLIYLLLYFPVTYKACNSCDLFSTIPPPPPLPFPHFWQDFSDNITSMIYWIKTKINSCGKVISSFLFLYLLSNTRLRFNPNKAISYLLVKAVTFDLVSHKILIFFHWKAQSFNLMKHQKIHVIFLFPMRFKIWGNIILKQNRGSFWTMLSYFFVHKARHGFFLSVKNLWF